MKIFFSGASVTIPVLQRSALRDIEFAPDGTIFTGNSAAASLKIDTAPQLDTSVKSLQAALASNALNTDDPADPLMPGESRDLQAALSQGVVNPADWLSQSDKDLIHSAAGVTHQGRERL